MVLVISILSLVYSIYLFSFVIKCKCIIQINLSIQ